MDEENVLSSGVDLCDPLVMTVEREVAAHQGLCMRQLRHVMQETLARILMRGDRTSGAFAGAMAPFREGTIVVTAPLVPFVLYFLSRTTEILVHGSPMWWRLLRQVEGHVDDPAWFRQWCVFPDRTSPMTRSETSALVRAWGLPVDVRDESLALAKFLEEGSAPNTIFALLVLLLIMLPVVARRAIVDVIKLPCPSVKHFRWSGRVVPVRHLVKSWTSA